MGLGLGAALVLGAGNAAAEPGPLPQRPFVGYVESWSETPAEHGAATRLARLPGYVNVVMLAFARPDMYYGGDLELLGTGLEMPYSGAVLAEAVKALKARNPGTRVLLSVGGATYGDWRGMEEEAIARLVMDLGLDGVDIDLEDENPACRSDGTGRRVCATDRLWRRVVSRLRKVLPRPYIIGIAGWSVAAYGEGAFADARPVSPHTGELLRLFGHKTAADIDLVSVMAYDATADYDPAQAFAAYRAAWSGPLALGVLVPPRGHGQQEATVDGVAALAEVVAADPLGGMMLYSLQKVAPAGFPSAEELARTICGGLDLGGCDAPLEAGR